MFAACACVAVLTSLLVRVIAGLPLFPVAENVIAISVVLLVAFSCDGLLYIHLKTPKQQSYKRIQLMSVAIFLGGSAHRFAQEFELWAQVGGLQTRLSGGGEHGQLREAFSLGSTMEFLGLLIILYLTARAIDKRAE